MGKGQHKGNKIYEQWKNGIKIPLCVDFIVYIPNYLLAGFIQREELGKIDCDNQHPHMTLFLRQGSGATAKESNDVLEILYKNESKIFEKRAKRVVGLDIAYYNASKIMYVIDMRVEL